MFNGLWQRACWRCPETVHARAPCSVSGRCPVARLWEAVHAQAAPARSLHDQLIAQASEYLNNELWRLSLCAALAPAIQPLVGELLAASARGPGQHMQGMSCTSWWHLGKFHAPAGRSGQYIVRSGGMPPCQHQDFPTCAPQIHLATMPTGGVFVKDVSSASHVGEVEVSTNAQQRVPFCTCLHERSHHVRRC